MRYIQTTIAAFAFAASAVFANAASQIKTEIIDPVVKINENCSASWVKLAAGYRLLTANHCVSGDREGFVVDEIRNTKDHKLLSYRQLMFDVERTDGKSDLALLKVRDETYVPAATVTIAEKLFLEEGDDVFIVGYPHAMTRTVTKGLFNGFQTIDDMNRTFYRSSANATGGNSGGAVAQFNPETFKYEQIGVTDMKYNDNEFMTLITTLEDIRSFLRLDLEKPKSMKIDER